MTSQSTTHNLVQTPFGFDSTAAEVIEGIDLSGKTAIVTGGSSGIGVETARALASAGASVALAVRDTDAGARTAAQITASTGSAAIQVGRLDLADPRSVAEFAADWSGPLHLLVNIEATTSVQVYGAPGDVVLKMLRQQAGGKGFA
jgi:NAD(P)-dependent dehydrogenase (short-subunit alcohol dehydrogenase family)